MLCWQPVRVECGERDVSARAWGGGEREQPAAAAAGHRRPDLTPSPSPRADWLQAGACPAQSHAGQGPGMSLAGHPRIGEGWRARARGGRAGGGGRGERECEKKAGLFLSPLPARARPRPQGGISCCTCDRGVAALLQGSRAFVRGLNSPVEKEKSGRGRETLAFLHPRRPLSLLLLLSPLLSPLHPSVPHTQSPRTPPSPLLHVLHRMSLSCTTVNFSPAGVSRASPAYLK